ncbi:MAG: nucleotidyltransferase domain-containing protein [Candidatus Electrothrix sp. Rat3]|nr:nucleotidyltransferase domain-containing protein [Candidatus Electrothrix rattekaaiensis]
MAEIPDKIKKTVRAYLSALQQNNIPIKEAVLFGSYATGKNHEWSDIDRVRLFSYDSLNGHIVAGTALSFGIQM